MTPEAYDYLDRLLTQINVLKGVRDGSLQIVDEPHLVRSLIGTAEKLREARAKPMTEVINPWTDWNMRNSIKPEAAQ